MAAIQEAIQAPFGWRTRIVGIRLYIDKTSISFNNTSG